MPRTDGKRSAAKTAPAVTPATISTPQIVKHEVTTKSTFGDAVKWGIGTSVGHSVASWFGFGPKQTVQPVQPTNTAYTTDYVQCLKENRGDASACDHHDTKSAAHILP